MTQQQQSLAKQEVKTKQQRQEKQSEQAKCCHNCGTPCHSGDKFCEECGMPLRAESCVRCNAPTQPGWEICPQCGQRLQAEMCSFCGSEMEASHAFCLECGNPRAGIVCADCDTLNFRSFCRKCNRPLNEIAEQEMLKAKNDPVFQSMMALAQELAQLEEKILGAQSPQDQEDPIEAAAQIEMSDADKKLIEQYKELLAGSVPAEKAIPTAPAPPSQAQAKPRTKLKLSIKKAEADQAKQDYKEKLEEMKRLMEKLRPEGDITPQLQRNYYSARKVHIKKKIVTKDPVGWVCNLCGCKHRQPSECAQPELGGTWIYEDIITFENVYDYPDD